MIDIWAEVEQNVSANAIYQWHIRLHPCLHSIKPEEILNIYSFIHIHCIVAQISQNVVNWIN